MPPTMPYLGIRYCYTLFMGATRAIVPKASYPSLLTVLLGTSYFMPSK